MRADGKKLLVWKNIQCPVTVNLVKNLKEAEKNPDTPFCSKLLAHIKKVTLKIKSCRK